MQFDCTKGRFAHLISSHLIVSRLLLCLVCVLQGGNWKEGRVGKAPGQQEAGRETKREGERDERKHAVGR